jgi:prolyl-tRNA synthetase
MMTQYVSSYRDLPAYVYQFQTKLRNELRAKSGIMRGREFVMKDMYSYSADEEMHQAFYGAATQAYLRVFARAGLGDRTYLTFASGGAFTQFSHEFQTLSDVGEDVIYIHEGKNIAINKEVLQPAVLEQLGVKQDELKEAKAIEVGNIFSFGGAKSAQLGLTFRDKDGEEKPVILGSYGIGVTRLMGTIVEVFADDKGIVWPEAVAPFKVHLISLVASDVTTAYADALYEDLVRAGVEVLYDDRDARAGEKLADSELIGIPVRIVVGKTTIENGKVEVVDRATGAMTLVDRAALVGTLATDAQETREATQAAAADAAI